jgi:WD40 repeat protein
MFFLLLLVQPALAQDSGTQSEVISIENASRLQQVDQLGYGWLRKALWHPDGQRLFVAGSNALVVYSVDDWTQPHVIRVSRTPLINMVFSDDGSRTALDQEGIITVIDNHTYERLYEVEAYTYTVDMSESIMHFFTESYLVALIVVGQYARAFGIWDAASGEPIDTIPYSYSSDSLGIEMPGWPLSDDSVDQILGASSVYLSPAVYEQELIEVGNVQRKPARVSLTPDGQHILYRLCPDDDFDPEICTVSQVLIRNRDTQQTVREFELETRYSDMTFVGNDVDRIGSVVCTAADRNYYCQTWQVSILDTQNGEVIGSLPGYFINRPRIIQYPTPAYDLSQRERFIMAADSARGLVWDASTYDPVAQLTGFHGPPLDIAFSRDGQKMAVSGKSKHGGSTINLWQKSETGFRAAGGIPCGGAIDLHPSGHLLICGGASSEFWGIHAPMELWDISDKPWLVQRYDDDMVSDVAFSPDGEWLVVGQRLIDLRNVRNRETQTTIQPGHFFSHLFSWLDIVKSATVSPEKSLLFDLSDDVDMDELSASVFSSDARRLAIGVFRQSIRIYDVNSGQLLHSLPTDGAATELAFSPDNELLAAVICQTRDIEQTANCLFQLIGVETGTVLYTSPMFEEAIYDLAFNPDGTVIATAHGRIEVHHDDGRSKENAVRLWGVP